MYMPIKNSISVKNQIAGHTFSSIPCTVTTYSSGSDDSSESTLDIKLVIVVSSNGFYLPNPEDENKIILNPNYEGWRDLQNLIDLIKAEIVKHQILNGVALDSKSIRWQPFSTENQTPELAPYFYGIIEFSVKSSPYPKVNLAKYL